MPVSFVRQLGAESGVQLNPLKDNSEIAASDNSDQIFGIIMHAERGRIDQPFMVTRGNLSAKLGTPRPIAENALNEAYVQVVEALDNGAYCAIVQRLANSNSTIKTAFINLDQNSGKISFSTKLEANSIIGVKHLECFNDGFKLSLHAAEVKNGGIYAPNNRITLKMLDVKTDEILYEFSGSLDPNAKDDFDISLFLADIAAKQTANVEIEVFSAIASQIPPNADCYGFDEMGRQKWATSEVLVCFEGAKLTNNDYRYAKNKLQNSVFDYAYLVSGGSRSPLLLGELANLAFEQNKQLRFDVPGNLTVEGAISFLEQLNLSSNKTAHLLHAFWTPLKTACPAAINASDYIGTAALNVAYACARNADKNAKGFAAKNYPIAGRNYPLTRRQIKQMITPSNQELSMLAKAKINPVLFETYTGGGRYVFRDSLTLAPVENSAKKLISVADMSTSIDDAITRAAKDFLQLPMQVAINKMRDFLSSLFEAAEASGWLVVSDEPNMNGCAFKFIVAPNQAKPFDCLDVLYWLRYDGTARQIFVTQTLSK